jgi:hypothetical protein
LAVNEPSDAACTTVTGVHVDPGVAGSWSISMLSPASLAGTVPLIDTPLRTNADAADEIVIPSLVALTVPEPEWTLGFVLDPGPVPAPPDPAQARPGMTRTPAAAVRNEAR